MATALRLTVREVADSIARTTGNRHPIWKVRRIVDALDARGVIAVQRVGLYRTVADAEVGLIAEELRRQAAPESEAVTNV